MEIIGHTTYRELTAQQHDDFKSVFEKFFNDIKPVRLVEIGTAQGGAALAFNDIMKSLQYPYQFRSYDVNEYPWYSRLIDEGIDLRIELSLIHI